MAKVVYVKSARVRKDADGNVKPNLVCEVHDDEIKPGDGYKHVSLKTGPYSSVKRIRCLDAPNWQPWEISNSLDARVQQIHYEAAKSLESAETKEDFEAAAEEIAESITELVDEKRESAQNIEDGFGHPTQQSEELSEIADSLESWADAVSSAGNDLDDEPDEDDYKGDPEPDTYQTDLESWVENAREAIQEAVDSVEY